MNQLDKLKKAWLAGFIDGEGYVGLTFPRKKRNLIFGSFAQISSLSYNCKYQPGSFLIGEGRLYILNKKSGNRKESGQYKLTNMDRLLEILESILPYLKVKEQQFKVLINFIKRRKNISPPTGRDSGGVTSFAKDDEGTYKLLLSLNKKGN